MEERVWDTYLTERDKKVFKASGYGGRAGFGLRPALLIVDVNYAFVGEEPVPILESIRRWRNSCGEEGWRSVAQIRRLLDAVRERNLLVFYTTGTRRSDGMDSGGWAWKNSRNSEGTVSRNIDGNEIVAEIAPRPEDFVVKKLKPSAFFGTPLLSLLIDFKVDSLIVAGTTTSGCVRATVIDAFSNNIRCMVVEEACFDRSEASHAINLCDMNAKYADVIGIDETLCHVASLSDDLYSSALSRTR